MLLIITEEKRMIHFSAFREAKVQEKNNSYELSIRGIPDGNPPTGWGAEYPVANFDEESHAEEALRSLLQGVKKGEWDANGFKDAIKDA